MSVSHLAKSIMYPVNVVHNKLYMLDTKSQGIVIHYARMLYMKCDESINYE